MKNPRSVLIPLLCLLILAGCASRRIQNNYFKSYQINEYAQANVGAPMITFKNIMYVIEKRWVGILFSSDGWEETKKPTDESFMEELIYTGRSGDTISVSYREYKSDFARPAFFQELHYDLRQSKIIVFRNYKIEVAGANNQFIRFKVLTD